MIILRFVLIALLSCMLISCNVHNIKNIDFSDVNSKDADTISMMVPAGEIVSTYSPATVPPHTEEITVDEETYPPYEDKFTSFMQVGNYDIFINKSAVIIPEQRWGAAPRLAFFKVVGMEEEYETDCTFYEIQFVEIYGMEHYDKEKVYTMAWLGHPEEQLYGRPPLEIGKVYARVWLPNEEDMKTMSRFPAGLIYKVAEDDGKQYLYGYGVDLSQMECSIKITDPVENCPYEKGKHDKAIAYLQSIGKPLPTFDYKCEARAFYEECVRRCS